MTAEAFFSGMNTCTIQVLCSVFSAARSGYLIPPLVYFSVRNTVVYFFFPMLVLPSTGGNQNCPAALPARGVGRNIACIPGFPCFPCSAALGWRGRRSHPYLRHAGWLLRVSRFELLNGSMFVTIQSKHFLSVGNSGYIWVAVLILKGSILLCSEERNWELVSARFGKWGCWGWVRGSDETGPLWPSLRAAESRANWWVSCYLLQQPCFWDLVRFFGVRCCSLFEELAPGLGTVNMNCLDDHF